MKEDNTNHWQEGVPLCHSWNPASTTEYWSGLDTEENFEKNPHPDYTKTSITYTYNQFGFRTKEFDFTDTENNILCLGCSQTEGIGVQTPWPDIIQENLPTYKVYNLGHGSGSPDTVSRLITNYAPLLKPKKVFILWPNSYRFENYDELGIEYMGSWSTKEYINLLTDQNALNWFERNKIYVKMFAKIYNFQLYEDTTDNWRFKTNLLDLARDNQHMGLNTQKAVAETFLKNILC